MEERGEAEVLGVQTSFGELYGPPPKREPITLVLMSSS